MYELQKKVNNNIFRRIISFFSKFLKKEENIKYIAEKSTVSVENQKKDFKQELQGEINKDNKKDDIINQIENNPDIIYQLSDERLIQLIELYDEKISKLDNENIQLNNQIKRLQQN